MSGDLGLSDLSDDQLVALAGALAAEIGRRSVEVFMAAQEFSLNAAEKARVAKRAAEQEAAAMRDEERRRTDAEARAKARASAPAQPDTLKWHVVKAAAEMVAETLGEGWALTVWVHPETREKRVYLDAADEAKVSYYATGSARNVPGQVETAGFAARGLNPRALRSRLAAIGAFVAAELGRRNYLSLDAARAMPVQAAPWPQSYLDARSVP